MLDKEQFNRMTEYWNFSNLHLRYEWEDLTNVSEAVKERIRKYIEDFTLDKDVIFERFKAGKPPGLFLFSHQTGTAKTTLIHLIAKELLLKKKGIKKFQYLQSIEMFNELKKMFRSEGGMNSSDMLSQILQADLFFLDDFDKLIRWSEWEREQGTLIIDRCYTDMKPVIMTGNKSLMEMKSEKLEQHLFSRLFQMCEEVVIDTPQDFRTDKAPIKIEKRKFV